MTRITVTLNETIAKSLRGVQGALIEKLERDISFTTVVNLVLVGGLAGSGDFTSETWEILNNFLADQQINLDKEGLTDNYLNQLK